MKKLRCTIFNFLEFCECISFAIWHLNSLIISGGSIWLAHTLGQFLIRGLTLNQIMLKYLLSPWGGKNFFHSFINYPFSSPFIYYDQISKSFILKVSLSCFFIYIPYHYPLSLLLTIWCITLYLVQLLMQLTQQIILL